MHNLSLFCPRGGLTFISTAVPVNFSWISHLLEKDKEEHKLAQVGLTTCVSLLCDPKTFERAMLELLESGFAPLSTVPIVSEKFNLFGVLSSDLGSISSLLMA